MKKGNLILLGVALVLAAAVVVVLAANKTCMVTVTMTAEDGAEGIEAIVELTDADGERYVGGESLSTAPGAMARFRVKKGSYTLAVKDVSDENYTGGDPVEITVKGSGDLQIILRKKTA